MADCLSFHGPVTSSPTEGQKVYRVIDDGDCVLTTLDPVKALRRLQEVLDKHEILWAWYDEETLQ